MKEERKEFAQITESYEVLMLKASIAFAAVQFSLEIVFYFIMVNTGDVLVSVFEYFLLYVVSPLLINTAGIGAAVLCRLSKRKKGIYITKAPLFAMEVVCFSNALFHMEFPALSLAFVIPPICSIFYTSKSITRTVTVLSIVLEIAGYSLSSLLPGFNDYRGFGVEQILNQVLYVVAIILTHFLVLGIMAGEKRKKELYIELEKEEHEVRKESVTDVLTGLFNRRKLRETFDEMFDEESGDEEWTFVLADLDDFKEINDNYGHSVGDEYLRTFGEIMREIAGRKTFRYGGDEFCFITTSADRAEALCAKIRDKYLEAPVCREYTPNRASFGVAVWDGHETPSEWVARADEALYAAKKQKGINAG
ncbi:MAG: diguanylate cyclase [Lachnospiraceae bacterium]|nr:diguanylate cyclase [Lachnospiraceae bacterium]